MSRKISNKPEEPKLFSVIPEALRSDERFWVVRSLKMSMERKRLPQPIPASDNDDNDVENTAIELVNTYLKYCEQGEKEFFSIAESLQKAAKDYEDTEQEVF